MKKNKTKITKSGFSLTEILIVIAIMAILGGALFATNNSKKAQNDVTSQARQIAAQLRLLQNEAINGKLVAGQSAYYFTFVANPLKTYYTNYANSSNTSLSSSAVVNLKNATLVGDGSASITVSFGAPRAELKTTTGLQGGNKMVLQSLDGSSKATICISSTGKIEEKNGDTAC